MEISNLPNEEFKKMVINMLTDPGRNLMSRARTSKKKWRSPNKNDGVEKTMHNVKNTLEEFNSRFDKAIEKKSMILKTWQWKLPKKTSKKEKIKNFLKFKKLEKLFFFN